MTGNIDTGAATLEQQLAKNLYFPKNNGLFSKVAEAELALKLDAHYSKNDILRMYLAEVYFGHGFYGLPAAARGYFGVMPVQLSWAQAQGSGHGDIFCACSGLGFDLVAEGEVGAGVAAVRGGEVFTELGDGGGGAPGW